MITMPKAKPTQVIVHRIELQETEREMLQTLTTAKSINNLALPIAAGGAVYVAYKIGYAMFGWTEDIFDDVKGRMADAKERFAKEKETWFDGKNDVTSDSFENPFNNDGYADDGTPTNWLGLPGTGLWPGVI